MTKTNKKFGIFSFLFILVLFISLLISSIYFIYFPYVKKTQIAEAINFAQKAKENVNDYYEFYGQMPENSIDAGWHNKLSHQNIVSNIEIKNGLVIVSLYKNILNEKSDLNMLIFVPIGEMDSFEINSWICSTPSEDNFKELPKKCQNISI